MHCPRPALSRRSPSPVRHRRSPSIKRVPIAPGLPLPPIPRSSPPPPRVRPSSSRERSPAAHSLPVCPPGRSPRRLRPYSRSPSRSRSPPKLHYHPRSPPTHKSDSRPRSRSKSLTVSNPLPQVDLRSIPTSQQGCLPIASTQRTYSTPHEPSAHSQTRVLSESPLAIPLSLAPAPPSLRVRAVSQPPTHPKSHSSTISPISKTDATSFKSTQLEHTAEPTTSVHPHNLNTSPHIRSCAIPDNHHEATIPNALEISGFPKSEPPSHTMSRPNFYSHPHVSSAEPGFSSRSSRLDTDSIGPQTIASHHLSGDSRVSRPSHNESLERDTKRRKWSHSPGDPASRSSIPHSPKPSSSDDAGISMSAPTNTFTAPYISRESIRSISPASSRAPEPVVSLNDPENLPTHPHKLPDSERADRFTSSTPAAPQVAVPTGPRAWTSQRMNNVPTAFRRNSPPSPGAGRLSASSSHAHRTVPSHVSPLLPPKSNSPRSHHDPGMSFSPSFFLLCFELIAVPLETCPCFCRKSKWPSS